MTYSIRSQNNTVVIDRLIKKMEGGEDFTNEFRLIKKSCSNSFQVKVFEIIFAWGEGSIVEQKAAIERLKEVAQRYKLHDLAQDVIQAALPIYFINITYRIQEIMIIIWKESKKDPKSMAEEFIPAIVDLLNDKPSLQKARAIANAFRNSENQKIRELVHELSCYLEHPAKIGCGFWSLQPAEILEDDPLKYFQKVAYPCLLRDLKEYEKWVKLLTPKNFLAFQNCTYKSSIVLKQKIMESKASRQFLRLLNYHWGVIQEQHEKKTGNVKYLKFNHNSLTRMNDEYRLTNRQRVHLIQYAKSSLNRLAFVEVVNLEELEKKWKDVRGKVSFSDFLHDEINRVQVYHTRKVLEARKGNEAFNTTWEEYQKRINQLNFIDNVMKGLYGSLANIVEALQIDDLDPKNVSLTLPKYVSFDRMTGSHFMNTVAKLIDRGESILDKIENKDQRAGGTAAQEMETKVERHAKSAEVAPATKKEPVKVDPAIAFSKLHEAIKTLFQERRKNFADGSHAHLKEAQNHAEGVCALLERLVDERGNPFACKTDLMQELFLTVEQFLKAFILNETKNMKESEAKEYSEDQEKLLRSHDIELLLTKLQHVVTADQHQMLTQMDGVMFDCRVAGMYDDGSAQLSPMQKFIRSRQLNGQVLEELLQKTFSFMAGKTAGKKQMSAALNVCLGLLKMPVEGSVPAGDKTAFHPDLLKVTQQMRKMVSTLKTDDLADAFIRNLSDNLLLRFEALAKYQPGPAGLEVHFKNLFQLNFALAKELMRLAAAKKGDSIPEDMNNLEKMFVMCALPVDLSAKEVEFLQNAHKMRNLRYMETQKDFDVNKMKKSLKDVKKAKMPLEAVPDGFEVQKKSNHEQFLNLQKMVYDQLATVCSIAEKMITAINKLD